MKKRTLLAVVSLLSVAALTFGGCMPQKTNQATDVTKDGKIRVSVGNWPPDNDTARIETFNKYIEKMNEKYPEIEIVKDTWSYDVSTFLPKAASGSLPVVFQTYFTECNKIIDAKYARDITKQVKEWGYDKKINPQLLKLVERDEKIYGIPSSAYVLGLACNVALYKEAGLVDSEGIPLFPETYDEMLQNAITIKEKTGKAGFFLPTTNNMGGWQFVAIARGFGAEFVEQKDGKWKAIFNSPECAEALQFIKDLKWKYNVLQDDVLCSVDEFYKLYGNNQVAMGIMQGALHSLPVRLYNMKHENASMTSMVGGKAGRYALLGGTVNIISPNATDAQVDGAIKWLEITGVTPEVTEQTEESWKIKFEEQKASNRIIYDFDFNIWDNEDWKTRRREVIKPYVNVNEKLFDRYTDYSSIELRSEPEANAQDLYAILDSALQTVLTEKDADVEKVLAQAAENFQKNYLDKIN